MKFCFNLILYIKLYISSKIIKKKKVTNKIIESMIVLLNGKHFINLTRRRIVSNSATIQNEITYYKTKDYKN